MTIPPPSEQHAKHEEYLIVRREAIIFFGYSLMNTVLSIIAASLLISTNLWYIIAIPLIVFLFSIFIYTFIRQKFIYRLITTALVILGSIAAISIIDSNGLLLLGINLVYFCGIASIGKKYDYHEDPGTTALFNFRTRSRLR